MDIKRKKELLDTWKNWHPEMGAISIRYKIAGDLFPGISKDTRADFNSNRFKLSANGYDRVENPNLTKDIQDFSLALNDLGELTGERLRTPARIIGELECY